MKANSREPMLASSPWLTLTAKQIGYHLDAMNVSAIFDSEYDGDASGAVWLVDTVKNRNWFEQQEGLDSNSALFLVQGYETKEKALCNMIWSIQEHHADWETISATGMELTDSIRKGLQDDGRLEDVEDGFTLNKN